MKYNPLGACGLRVSRLSLGTMNFGDSTDEKEGIRIVHAALDRGINLIDTADVYSHGASEEIVGKALKDRRDEALIATKCWANFGDGPNEGGSSRHHIMEAAEAALRRLQTDHIDLFIMHRPDEANREFVQAPTPIEETLGTLTDLVRQGKVRYIGTSCYPEWKIVESQLVSRYEHLARFCSDQLNYSIMNRYVEKQVLPVAGKYGVGITVFSPLNYGWLSGRYRRGVEPPTDSRAARRFKMSVEGRHAEGRFDLLEQLEPVVERSGVPMPRFALAWVLANPLVSSVICGPRTLEHLEDNVKAADVELDAEFLAAVNEIAPRGSGPGHNYSYAWP